ncbi:MAG: DUF3787 domain-containing protein [Clostridiales bacterium]|nr:DUF3787 domain-containing protein [Clostridiales bacterium]
MKNNKKKYEPNPREKHTHASWRNIEKLKPESRVFIPNELEVINAKDYVDSNQK